MRSIRPAPVLMIALDAAEPRLIERWMNDDSLSYLKHLRDLGGYGRLASTADQLVGSPWPTFYTGTTPAEHGCYHYLQWRADKMATVRLTPDWMPLQPFWRPLSAAGPRVVVLDIPFTYAPKPFNGVEISGWATHDLLSPPYAYPRSIMAWVRRHFGVSPRTDERYGLLSIKELLQIRDELVETTGRVTDLAVALMDREPWDLFMVGFGATHRGGHKLWSLTGAQGRGHPYTSEGPSEALREIYIACDAVVRRLVETAGDGVITLVFSLHGMGPNTCRAGLLSEMLARVLAGGRNDFTESNKASLVEGMRKLVPLKWRHNIKHRLPLSLQDKLTTFWRMRGIDWKTTRAASLAADLQGYIRINLRGRERDGIVEPGTEYDQLCAEITDGLNTFVDADTGKPIVESIMRADQLYAQGRRKNYLPDLIVRWTYSPTALHRVIVSPRYGSILWPTPGKNPDGRSGNHRHEGFLIATGNRIQPGSRIQNAHILDLAPTVYALFNISKPPEMYGNVLPAIRAG